MPATTTGNEVVPLRSGWHQRRMYPSMDRETSEKRSSASSFDMSQLTFAASPVNAFAEAEGEKGWMTRTWFGLKEEPIFA